ncbi:MAG: DUF3592 domain-containing protein [Lysobacterales bacterium]
MALSKSSKEKTGAGCLGLFGGVFVLAGFIPGGMGVAMLFNAWQASDWTPTPATLMTIELSSSTSDGSTTYSLDGTFRYEFDGQIFTSDQLDFNVGSDNIGDYHQSTYGRLQPQLNVRDGVTAFVDPDEPSTAVLVREIRWGMVAFLMMFLAVFGGVGAVIVGMGVAGGRKRKANNLLRNAHPQEPWRWEPEWEHGEIHCSGKSTMWVAVAMAVFWNLISSFVWVVLPEALADGEWVALLMLLFPAVGVGLAVWAVGAVLRWRRYGRTTLVLDDLPVRLGGALNGHLKVSTALHAREILVTLSCIRITTSGSGKNRRTTETVLFQDDYKASVENAGNYRRIRVEFPIPVDQPSRDVSNSRRKVQWRLKANAKVAGPDLDVQFDLPVFEGGMLDPIQNLGAVGDEDDPAQVDRSTLQGGDVADTGVVMHYRGGGLKYYFPAARHKGLGAAFAVAGAIALAVGIMGHGQGDMPLFVAIFVGAFGVLFLFIGLNTLLWRSELQTRIGQLGVRSGWWLGRDHYYRVNDIKHFKIFGNLRVGTTQYFQLSLKTQDGKKRVLASGLKGKRNTEALVTQIANAIGFDNPLG